MDEERMDKLRKPFFIAAGVLALLIVLVELGSDWLKRVPAEPPSGFFGQAIGEQLKGVEGAEDIDKGDLEKSMKELHESSKPPGIAIKCMAFVDGLILYNMILLTLSLVVRESVQGRVQGVVTFIVSLLTIIGAFITVFIVLALLLLMVGLFVAAPFGTLAYLAMWGFFDRGGASVTLSLLMAMKLGFVICLVLAQQRFLKNKGMIFLVLTSLLLNVVIGFLHGFVPIILVSITDAIGALVAVVLGLIWAIVFFIFSIVSVVKAIV